jgi:hypothetical protein
MQPTLEYHHPVFQKFPNLFGPLGAEYRVDFFGIKTRAKFLSAAFAESMRVRTVYPPVDEEYFGWIDLLESVAAARGSYTMMELGAGYGRWAIRAGRVVALQRQIPFHLVAVEAEPQHFKWLQQHLRDNEIDPREHTLLNAAVSDRPGKSLFYIADRRRRSGGEVVRTKLDQVL